MNEMRIYVASLSDYNNGRLEGKWLDLSDYSDASELMEAIQEMLDELTEKYKSVDGEVREEFAVHDYEGIPATLASEYMGEQDFQQLYDIAEVADEFNIPVAVLIERAGDTGSDDYQALADSLIMVVDGNDESDIVAEYEDQIGELGFDWWSNYVGITKTDQRLLYGEDVDNFKEEILYENPDMDESEAEGQAEERADDEQEQRNSDLIGYLQERGYENEFPNWVYKDYEDAWKNGLSYDFDVIHHDGEMYVFTNNYSLGGTILSGVIGAYIGYKIGRAKPQKKGFSTEKKIGRNIKGAFSKKKMADGGEVDEDIQFAVVIKKDDKNYNKIGYSKLTEFITDKQGNEFDKLYFEGKKLPKKYNAEDLNYSVRELDTFTSSTGDRKFILLKELTDDNRIYYYILHYDDKKVYAESYDMNFIKSELKRLTNGKNFYSKAGVNFGEGGEVNGGKIIKEISTHKAVKKGDKIYIYIKGLSIQNEDDRVLEKQHPDWYKDELIMTISSENEDDLFDIFESFEENNRVNRAEFSFAKGGGIGFKGLSSKVAKRYEGESVAPKYQSQYGTTYSKSEAKEVGDKVAGKVYWNQQGRKMANGGGVSYNQQKNFAEGGENTRLRTWYTKTYPEDERGKYIDMYNTFADLWNALQNKNNVYNVIVEGDSLIRERLFQKLSQIKGVDYKTIYNLWLEGDEDEDEDGDGIDTFAKGGGVSYNKVWEVIGINQFGKMFKEKITLGRMSDKEDVANALRRRTDLNIREITSIKEVFAKGGMTEHGLMAGDKILGEYSKYSNDVEIADKNNKFVIVDLDKGMRSRTMGDVKKEYLAKGGGVSEFWTEINESTLNERLPYDLGVVNEDEDLISGNIWIKFRKSPMEMPSYELKRAISEDFEYFGYGNQEPPKRVSLMDGSWGSFYIHVENLTLNEIMTLLLELPEQVQIRLEERKIKGYKDLGLDTYGQSLDLRISQSSDDDDYEYANGGMVDYSVWTDFDKEALKSKNGSYLMSEKEALKMAKEYKKMFPTNEITIRKGEIITEYDFNSKIFKKYAVGGGVDNKKEWIAIYSRGNGQQIVVVKAKDKSEAYREAEMSRGNYKLGSDWQMIDIYESQYAKGGGISGLDDLLRG